MRVIDVRSFDIPSDENDYDELVAFADTMACIPQFDAVPIEVLDKIREEIKLMTSNRGILSCSVRYIHKEIDKVFDKYKSESENP